MTHDGPSIRRKLRVLVTYSEKGQNMHQDCPAGSFTSKVFSSACTIADIVLRKMRHRHEESEFSTMRFSCLLAMLFLSTPHAYAQNGATSPNAVKTDRVLFLGNSITLHGPSESIGWTGNWGMAASAADKDYVHLVTQSLSQQYASASTANGPQTPQIKIENIADFERQYTDYPVEEKLQDFLRFKPDLVIVAIGENVPDLFSEESKTQFYGSVTKLLRTIQANGNPTIVVRSCFWPNADKDAILKRATTDVSGIFVDISALSKDDSNFARSERKIEHSGVAAHPGDNGMRAIANAIIDAIKKNKTQ